MFVLYSIVLAQSKYSKRIISLLKLFFSKNKKTKKERKLDGIVLSKGIYFVDVYCSAHGRQLLPAANAGLASFR